MTAVHVRFVGNLAADIGLFAASLGVSSYVLFGTPSVWSEAGAGRRSVPLLALLVGAVAVSSTLQSITELGSEAPGRTLRRAVTHNVVSITIVVTGLAVMDGLYYSRHLIAWTMGIYFALLSLHPVLVSKRHIATRARQAS